MAQRENDRGASSNSIAKAGSRPGGLGLHRHSLLAALPALAWQGGGGSSCSTLGVLSSPIYSMVKRLRRPALVVNSNCGVDHCCNWLATANQYCSRTAWTPFCSTAFPQWPNLTDYLSKVTLPACEALVPLDAPITGLLQLHPDQPALVFLTAFLCCNTPPRTRATSPFPCHVHRSLVESTCSPSRT